MIDVLKRITEYRNQKNWTEYQLAEKSGLTQSTISSWYRKNMLPSIGSLEKICDAFEITLSQFFAADEDTFTLTPIQKELLEASNCLTQKQLLLFIELFHSYTTS